MKKLINKISRKSNQTKHLNRSTHSYLSILLPLQLFRSYFLKELPQYVSYPINLFNELIKLSSSPKITILLCFLLIFWKIDARKLDLLNKIKSIFWEFSHFTFFLSQIIRVYSWDRNSQYFNHIPIQSFYIQAKIWKWWIIYWRIFLLKIRRGDLIN
jgi:hypothetical protein